MSDLHIIGKCSSLYRWIKPDLENLWNISEYSHRDLEGIIGTKGGVVIVFGLADTLDSNIEYIDRIDSIFNGQKIYIGTTASLDNRGIYHYPTLKYNIEQYVLTKSSWCILRVGIVEEFLKKLVLDAGKKNVTNRRDFIRGLNELIKDKKTIVNAFKIEGKVNLSSRILMSLYSVLDIYPFSVYTIKILDGILKLLRIHSYGYTFWSNQKSVAIESYNHLLVGSGIAAFGVANQRDVEAIINPKGRRGLIMDPSMPNSVLEYIGNGGNSDRWHGVISLLSNEVYSHKQMKKINSFLKKRYLFNTSHLELLKNGYSFIPFKPFRPFKRKYSCVNSIDEKVLKINIDNNRIKIITDLSEYTSNKLTLACGSLSTALIFATSGMLKSSWTCEDHMVGYFGQIKFKNRLRFGVIRTRKGHFKKYHRIQLSDSRIMYVNLRPALFKYKDFTVANREANVFGNDVKSIIAMLLKKMNISLIIEALYNKFGLTFVKTKCFNIVGHVSIPDIVEWKDNKFQYRSLDLELNEADIFNIKKHFLNTLDAVQSITISSTTRVKPGYHYMNASFVPDFPNLKVISSLKFKSSPEHPSISLLAQGYD